MTAQLVSQRARQFEGRRFGPGDVLPVSLQHWPHLPDAVRDGVVYVMGDPDGQLRTVGGQLVSVEKNGNTLPAMVRRNQVVSDGQPPELHVAAFVQRLERARNRLPAPVLPPAETPADATPPAATRPLSQRHKRARG